MKKSTLLTIFVWLIVFSLVACNATKNTAPTWTVENLTQELNARAEAAGLLTIPQVATQDFLETKKYNITRGLDLEFRISESNIIQEATLSCSMFAGKDAAYANGFYCGNLLAAFAQNEQSVERISTQLDFNNAWTGGEFERECVDNAITYRFEFKNNTWAFRITIM